MPVVALLTRVSIFQNVLHLHQGQSSRQNRNTDRVEEDLNGMKDDSFTMSVTGNTHLEATVSLLCFVVV